MAAVTYGVTRVPAAEAAERAQVAASQKSFFTRLMEAMMESRLQQARREIARHAHLLSRARDERGNLLIDFDLDEMLPGGR
jgi:hypothetical protein